MRLIWIGCLAFVGFQSCGVGSVACRRASQGDVPCQSLKGASFDSCQAATQRAHSDCRAEQFTSQGDAGRYYTLPK